MSSYCLEKSFNFSGDICLLNALSCRVCLSMLKALQL